MARRGRENFRFSTVELSALALSFTVTSALVFLLGFYVGRRVAAEHAPVAANVARVPVGAAPTEAQRRPSASEPAPAPASAPAVAQPGARAAAPTASPQTASQPAKPATAPAQGATALTPAAKVSAGAPATQPPPAPSQDQAQSAGRAAAPPSTPRAAASAVPQAAPGAAYTVQVLATRNRNDADALTSQLKKKGYGAYLVQVNDAGGAWYRVRIGHFDNSEAARRIAERASRELGLTQAYVSPLSSGSR